MSHSICSPSDLFSCNHWTLCKERVADILNLLDEHEVVPLNDKNRALLQDALRLFIESQEDCAICYDTPTDPLITACKHVFCRACIIRAIQLQHKCPMCRNQLTEDSLLEPAPEDAGDDASSFDAETQSSKTEAMLQILKATVRKPGSKVVVFSQWTSFLNIIEVQLKAEGIGFTRVDGSMKTDKRDSAIEALDNDPETRVMLASLAVCSVGLNLVAADTVILSDSCKSNPQFLIVLDPSSHVNRVGTCHRRPGHRPCSSPRPDPRDDRLPTRHGGFGRGACAEYPKGEAGTGDKGLPRERRPR